MAVSTHPALRWSLLILLFTILSWTSPVFADGAGMLGMGAVFISPRCGITCRALISGNSLRCDSGEETSTSSVRLGMRDHALARRRVVFPEPNTPQCYMSDAAFLRTMALCLETYCAGQDGLEVWEIEKWWLGHISSGAFLANFSSERKPVMPYTDALRLAKADVERMGDATPVLDRGPGKWLNVTSLIDDEEAQGRYAGYEWYESNLFSHTRNTVGIVISSVFLPVLLSALRFLPIRPLWYSRVVASLEKPLFGHRHRVPLKANIGFMPTRGQSLYLLYLLTTQIFLCIFPLMTSRFPGPKNVVAPSRHYEILFMIGERSGVIGMGNFVALFLFSSRNNVLLWITNWSQGTFLLLHGWIGYCTIIQVVIHSLLFLILYAQLGIHDMEVEKAYWIWGIVGTLAIVIIWPLSILPVRRKVYEVFLVSHQALSFLMLLATYWHIFLLFAHDWKFEIWVYLAGLLWAGDRVVRLMRLSSNGVKRAVVTPIRRSGIGGEDDGTGDGEAEYLRIDVDGVVATGHVYLYLPTLSWKVWENHPFSVLSTFTRGSQNVASLEGTKEKGGSSTSSSTSTSIGASVVRPRMTIILRPESGATRKLAARLFSTPSQSLTLPVLVEGAYNSNPTAKGDLEQCTSLLCFAGGVGISAVLPLVRSFGGVRSSLFWGVRDQSLPRALEAEFLSDLRGRSVTVQTSVGKRLDVREILRRELMERDQEERGDLGVVVCGPAGMADDVRWAIAEYGARSSRGVVFVDEAFSW